MTPFNHIAYALFCGPRGSGRTYRMLRDAPEGATVLCAKKSNINHVTSMARDLGRVDLKFFVPEGDNMQGKHLGRCIADHESLLAWMVEADDQLRAARMEAQSWKQAALAKARPIDEYSEDMGPVLWWRFPIEEAPYCGTPNDCGMTVEMRHYVMVNGEREVKTVRTDVGGWPGYHTHWTPINVPQEPKS